MLAPVIGIYGVCLGSVIAEATGFGIQLVYVKRYLNLKIICKYSYICDKRNGYVCGY